MMFDPNVLVAAFLIMSALAFGLWRLPHNECRECPHCKNIAHEKAVRDHDKFHRYYNIKKPDPGCKRCNGGMR